MGLCKLILKEKSPPTKGGNNSYSSFFQRRHKVIMWTSTIGSKLLNQGLRIRESCAICRCQETQACGLLTILTCFSSNALRTTARFLLVCFSSYVFHYRWPRKYTTSVRLQVFCQAQQSWASLHLPRAFPSLRNQAGQKKLRACPFPLTLVALSPRMNTCSLILAKDLTIAPF